MYRLPHSKIYFECLFTLLITHGGSIGADYYFSCSEIPRRDFSLLMSHEVKHVYDVKFQRDSKSGRGMRQHHPLLQSNPTPKF